jgi:glycosyltransferase involved in cell wall biosynthesis
MGGGLPAMLAAIIMRKRFIVRVTGEYAWEQGTLRFGVADSLDDFQMRRYHPAVEILRILEQWLVKRADAVIAPSEYLKNIIVQWGIKTERIAVIYNAVSIPPAITHEGKRSRADARKDLGISEDERVLVSIGRLVPWKGFCELIEMMPIIQRSFPKTKLYIIGDGPDDERIKKTIVRLDLGRAVVLVGRLDHRMLAMYVHAADCFVLNTGYEGFSHQLVEVLALGTPVVTTRVGGNPEIIEDGVTGQLVSYGDGAAFTNAVIDALTHAELRQRLSANGKKRALEFTVERMIQGVLDIL